MKKQSKDKKGYLYGTGTIGEKGQIVIPSEARAKLNLKKGEKLLVMDGGGDMLVLIKFSQIKGAVKELSALLKFKNK